jgi:hypothetical protein
MRAGYQRVLGILAAVATLVVASAAQADRVASPDEVRALRAKFAKSPPKPADYAAQPYPGAIFDADCSAQHTAPRQPGGSVYCFYTRDPVDRVRAFVKAEGKPRNGVMVTVDEGPVSVDGIVKIDKVTVITYWTNQSTMAYYENFPANPPSAADLIAPLYPGATYDRECSAAKSLEAKGKPKWRQVWCYVANEPSRTVGNAFDMELTSTSKRGVQIDIVEVSQMPPITQIQYWLTSAPPQAASAAPQQAQPAPQLSQQSTATASPTSAPTPAPSGSTPSSAGQAIDAVNKLRGVFGR